MKGFEIGNTNCQIYRTLNSKTSCYEMTLKELVTTDRFKDEVLYIREMLSLGVEMNLPKDKLKEMKRRVKSDKLAAAMISAECGEDKSVIVDDRPIICLDFDFSDNPLAFDTEEHIMKIKRWMIVKCPFVYAVAKSCSGSGIYAIVVMDGVDDFKERFDALRAYFSAIGLKCDESCSNKNRLRYVSYDETVQVKGDDDVVIPFTGKKKKRFLDVLGNACMKIMRDDVNNLYISRTTNELTRRPEFFLAAVEYIKDDIDLSSYNTWLRYACLCASFPDDSAGLVAFDLLSRSSGGYNGYEDVCSKFNEGKKLYSGDEYIGIYADCKRKSSKWVSEVCSIMNSGNGLKLKGLR